MNDDVRDRSFGLAALTARNAERQPDAPAISQVEGGRWTWHELDHEGRRWAAALAGVGVSPGDLVLTMLPNNAHGVLGWLAASALGAVEVPVNHAYVGTWLTHIFSNTHAAVAVVDARFWRQWEPVLAGSPLHTVVLVGGIEPVPAVPGVRVVDLVELLADVAPLAQVAAPGPTDLSCVVYTSGTTGPSKGVLVPWAQWEARYTSPYIPSEFRTADQVCYSTMGPFHITSKIPLYDAARQASALCTREGWKTEHFLDDVRTHGCTYTIMVGTMAHFLRLTPENPDDADTPLQLISMAPLFPGIEAFARRFGVRIVTAYSMTELPMAFCSNTFYEVSDENYRWCGCADPRFATRLVDERGEDVPPGQHGELVMQAPAGAITPGYLGMPEATADAWRDGWFHTGDVFVRDDEGRFAFVDRRKDAIRRRGENISSFEIEASVNAHPEVAESAAFAVPSEYGEDEVKVNVVLRPGSQLQPAELVTFLVGRVPRFALPRYVEIVAALPKTPTQRVQKNQLRAAGITPATWDSQAGRAR